MNGERKKIDARAYQKKRKERKMLEIRAVTCKAA